MSVMCAFRSSQLLTSPFPPPSLGCAQVRAGSASGIIDVLKLSEILDAVTILKLAGTVNYPLAQQTAFNTWVSSFFNWYSASALGKEARMAGMSIGLARV